MNARSSHWPRIARTWSLVGSPLRPIAADLKFFDQAIAARQAGRSSPPKD